ncbi:MULTISPECIES: ATP phosphoribosyltransferase regulatory subunit [Dictyoglomus]|jgi:ATP phosphoribosyltransferase regulatory subunit|uniref:ATP phosphoribosyltransferase regulatory subunit n=1 Tax=Dictyoglomus TaxID=13 RepID=UPI000CCF3AAA|nr:ATP phosphoribosyltransferase regulatory subunit [Dictyoglomus turgidum]PNV80727.1 MAG: ATP phosphoribosyltransferase regulatory subunit [Dictyoglomus turgidum]
MKRESLEKIIRRRLELWGYNEVRIPILYEDIWGKENLIYFEKNGKFLALRPEITREILKSIRYDKIPKRMFYMGPIFKLNGREVEENYQIGWELIYKPSLWRDVEVLLIIKEVFEDIGIDDYIIELGNTKIWDFILRFIKDEEKVKSLREFLVKRDYVSFLEKSDLSNSELKSEILNLFYYDSCDEDCVFLNSSLRDEINFLNSFKKLLVKLGFKEDKLIVNPALMRPYEYYDGIIFEVYLKNSKTSLGGGGSYIERNKYNELLYGFGFAFVEEKLLELVNGTFLEENIRYFVYPEEQFIRIYEDMRKEREKGIISVFIPKDEGVLE